MVPMLSPRQATHTNSLWVSRDMDREVLSSGSNVRFSTSRQEEKGKVLTKHAPRPARARVCIWTDAASPRRCAHGMAHRLGGPFGNHATSRDLLRGREREVRSCQWSSVHNGRGCTARRAWLILKKKKKKKFSEMAKNLDIRFVSIGIDVSYLSRALPEITS